MYYDLLIYDKGYFYAYGRIDTFSKAISICEKSSKGYSQIFYIRKVSSYGADCWKRLLKKSCSYSKLCNVDINSDNLISSIFKKKITEKICLIAN